MSLQTLQGSGTPFKEADLLEEEAKLRSSSWTRASRRGSAISIFPVREHDMDSCFRWKASSSGPEIGVGGGKLAEVEQARERLANGDRGSIHGTDRVRNLARFVDRVERLELTAPVRGIVQTLRYKSTGGVITPGETVGAVPLDDKLVVEVQLNPKDIGFVSVGQEANVRSGLRLRAVRRRVGHRRYHFRHDGPEPQRHALREIVLSRKALRWSEPAAQSILPGMVVQADIRTGERTLFQYLTKPINRAFQLGLVEPKGSAAGPVDPSRT